MDGISKVLEMFRFGTVIKCDPDGHLVSLQVDGAPVITRATLPEVQYLTIAQLILLAQRSPAPVFDFAVELESGKFEHIDVQVNPEIIGDLKEITESDSLGVCERVMHVMTLLSCEAAKRGPTPRNYKFVFKVQKINNYVDVANSATFEFTIVTKPEDKRK